MTNNQDNKKGMSPMAAGVAGAVVGAGIAVAGAMALKDEKNRAKVKGALNAVKKHASDYVDDLQEKTHEQGVKTKEKMEDMKKTTS